MIRGKRIDGRLRALGVYAEPRVAALLFFGFSSGLPLALTGNILFAWLTEEGISLGTIGLFAAVGTPYAIKFLWAPVIDRMPLGPLSRRLGRRRAWMLVTQVTLIALIAGMAAVDPKTHLHLTAILAVAVAFTSASQDVVIDAFRVESLEERQLAAGSAMYVFGYRFALQLVVGAGALYLATFVGWPVTYAIMAGLIVVGIIATLVNPEPREVETADYRERRQAIDNWRRAHPGLGPTAGNLAGFLYTGVVAPFLEFISRPGWLIILLFVVFYKFGDSLAGAMTNPFLLMIGFSKIDIANIVKGYGLVATLAGLALGGWMMNAIGLYRSLWICGVLQLVSNFMFAVQAMVGADLLMLAATIGFENLAGGMGTAVFVAYLSSLCNLAYTATQYALVSSFMAAARTWLVSGGGVLAESVGWIEFFVLTAFAAVPGLILLALLTHYVAPARRPASMEARDG